VSTRIIAGKHRGSVMEVPNSARPTLLRSRQSIFDILESLQPDKNFGFFFRDKIILDGFAGSGALGIEALSRGAKHVYFVDNDKIAISIVRNNIQKIHSLEKSSIIYSDIFRIGCNETHSPCDLVFLDPPYHKNFCFSDIAAFLLKLKWISNGTILIMESLATNAYQNIESDIIKVITSRKIGNSTFTIAQVS
jgi:16S rRNA (guanine966-N2)-methyltransferase